MSAETGPPCTARAICHIIRPKSDIPVGAVGLARNARQLTHLALNPLTTLSIDSDQAATTRGTIFNVSPFSCAVLGCEMPYAWYVTFELQKRGTLQKRRSPRETRTFETEREAREFARAKFHEGLVVHAGTLNPHLPRRTIPSSDVPDWLDDQREKDPADAHGSDRNEAG